MERKEQLRLFENSSWILATINKDLRDEAKIENYKLQELVGNKDKWIRFYKGEATSSNDFSAKIHVLVWDSSEYTFSYNDENLFAQDIKGLTKQVRQRQWLEKQGDPNGEAYKQLLMIND